MKKYDHKKIEKWPAQLKKVESGKTECEKFNLHGVDF